VGEAEKTERFKATCWPHLDAAYNLARWLTRREADADDVVQEALLRALKYFDGFRGSDARAWFLTIVRNTSYSWLKQHRSHEPPTDPEPIEAGLVDNSPGPETQALINDQQNTLRKALSELPLEFREVLVLRELEGLSYKEICAVSGVPIGTVMSRLARARDRLQQVILDPQGEIKREL
jgi:RNA polymerase sigma-70 factor (ECF subfamily)